MAAELEATIATDAAHALEAAAAPSSNNDYRQKEMFPTKYKYIIFQLFSIHLK